MKNGFSFNSFREELLANSENNYLREIDTKEERKYFLIVSEGEKTEPLYFDFFKKQLPNHLVNTIKIIGDGSNTISVVKKAINEKDNRLHDPLNPPYDEVWAVFDKDDFPDHRVNNAVFLAEKHGIEHGLSNQAFELWYLLHFNYLDTALHRNQYFDKLSEILGEDYKKNNKDVVEFIINNGDMQKAIIRAKKLEQLHKGKTPANSAPYTRIYLLVERLNKYCKI